MHRTENVEENVSKETSEKIQIFGRLLCSMNFFMEFSLNGFILDKCIFTECINLVPLLNCTFQASRWPFDQFKRFFVTEIVI